jgi:hypothetical protein
VQREWQARKPVVDFDQLRSRTAPEDVNYPWHSAEEVPSPEVLEKQDGWQKLFMPQGTILAGRTDQKHWLTFGVGPVLPVLVAKAPILMSDSSVQSPVRLGQFEEISSARWKQMQTDQKDNEQPRKIGWSILPERQQLNLRMSGLLWPEAAQRLANAAYLTREAKGKGQLILFADQPMFRGATLGTNRLLLNAVVYGPALGTDRTIIP